MLRWLHRGHRSARLIAEPARARLRARVYRLRHALTPFRRAPLHPLRANCSPRSGSRTLHLPLQALNTIARHPRGIGFVAAGCASTAVAAVVATINPATQETQGTDRVTLTRATLIEHGVPLHGLLGPEISAPFTTLSMPDPGYIVDTAPLPTDPEPLFDEAALGAIDQPMTGLLGVVTNGEIPGGPALAAVEPAYIPGLDDAPTGHENAALEALRPHHQPFFPESAAPSAWLEEAEALIDAASEPIAASPSISREDITVQAGDSLVRILRRAGYDHGKVNRLMEAGEEAQRLTRLHPGQRLTLLRDESNSLVGLHFPFARDRKLRIERAPDEARFQAEITERHMERRLVRAEGKVERSLYAAARKAGLSDRLIMELTNIFGWEVDLARELQPGNHFHVLYEVIDNGEDAPITGNIVAASLETRNREIEAVRFRDGDGRTDYYTPDGESLRREFKRHPINNSRISSGFDRNRLHPVLGVRRPHLGVDYAAPTGTPIRAAGDGRIVRRAWRGGYGRVVEIQHGSQYRTLYAHMSDYAPGLAHGDYVRRGDVIGYVGRSGMATGPHLHYEFIVNGRHRNPLTVELPQASPLPGEHMEAFREHATPLLSALQEDGEPTQLALRDESP